MKTRIAFFALLATLFVGVAAADVRPFVAGSLKQIQSEHAGRPFILTLWSGTCVHCPAELKALGELARKHPGLDIVLVAADTPDEAAQLEKLAQGYGLGKQSQWVFADAQPERLRFDIDRRWYGELPRTYFFDARHQREGRSGVIAPAHLENWAAEHVK